MPDEPLDPEGVTPDEDQQSDTPEEYQGERVRGVKVKVTGGVGDSRLNPRLRLGQEVVIVSTAICDGVSYKRHAQEGLQRSQSLAVDDGFIVLDALDAMDLLHRLRAERIEELERLLAVQGDLLTGHEGDEGGDAAPPTDDDAPEGD